jgi:hypothetical protein
MSIIYNADIPIRNYVDKNICLNSYTSRNYRLANIEKVYNREPGLRNLLDKAPLRHYPTKVLIDVRVQNLTKNQYTCANKGWHLDGKALIKPRTYYDSVFHIITWGGAPTIFIKHPFSTDELYTDQRALASSLNLDVHPRYELKPYTYYTYGEFHWHRCGRATEDCTRFFIRIIESYYIKERKIECLK